MRDRVAQFLLRDDVGDDDRGRRVRGFHSSVHEAGLVQPFAGGDPFDVAKIGAQALAPARVEDGRANVRRRGGVRIDLGRHVDPRRRGVGDHVDDHGHLPEARRADVDDVNRAAGARGVGDHLLDRGDRALRLLHPRVADMGEDGHAGFRGGLEHAKDLGARGAGLVLQRQTDSESAVGEPLPQRFLDGFDLFGTRLLVSRGLLVFAECQHPRRPVRRCGAEVDSPGTLALRVPLVDRERSPFEFEGRRSPRPAPAGRG